MYSKHQSFNATQLPYNDRAKPLINPTASLSQRLKTTAYLDVRYCTSSACHYLSVQHLSGISTSLISTLAVLQVTRSCRLLFFSLVAYRIVQSPMFQEILEHCHYVPKCINRSRPLRPV